MAQPRSASGNRLTLTDTYHDRSLTPLKSQILYKPHHTALHVNHFIRSSEVVFFHLVESSATHVANGATLRSDLLTGSWHQIYNRRTSLLQPQSDR